MLGVPWRLNRACRALRNPPADFPQSRPQIRKRRAAIDAAARAVPNPWHRATSGYRPRTAAYRADACATDPRAPPPARARSGSVRRSTSRILIGLPLQTLYTSPRSPRSASRRYAATTSRTSRKSRERFEVADQQRRLLQRGARQLRGHGRDDEPVALSRADVVERARDHDVHSKAARLGEQDRFRRRLACGVRIVRTQIQRFDAAETRPARAGRTLRRNS